MKHRSSQTLFAHWDERRGPRLVPERSDIDPSAIASALGDTFIAAYNTQEQHPFRLAGTKLCALFGRELRNEAFLALWREDDRARISALTALVANNRSGFVAGAVGRTASAESVDLELLLLPLQHGGQGSIRLIGTFSPLQTPYWLGSHPLASLTLGDHRFLAPAVAGPAPIMLRPPAGRLRRGFVIYDGGAD